MRISVVVAGLGWLAVGCGGGSPGSAASGGAAAGGTGAPATGGTASGGAEAAGGSHAAGGSTATGGQAGGESPGSGGASTGGTGAAAGGRGAGGVPGTGGTAGGQAETGAGGAAGKSGSAGASGAGGAGPVACPTPVLKAGDTTRTVQVGATSRSYVLHVPSKYDGTRATSLVLDFHGLGATGAQERASSPYPAQTDPAGVVMAFPNGLSGPQGTAWNLGSCCVDADDVAFAKALVADAEKVACIDPKHVYAVGYSIGGGMTHYLGCHAADVFAAIAPAAADLTKENAPGCMPARPITEVSFRGTADPAVAYGGGSISPIANMPLTGLGAVATFTTWAMIDQCTGTPSPADSNGCSSYTTCAGGAEVILCTKQGGGHDPGNAAVAWPILSRHALP